MARNPFLRSRGGGGGDDHFLHVQNGVGRRRFSSGMTGASDMGDGRTDSEPDRSEIAKRSRRASELQRL